MAAAGLTLPDGGRYRDRMAQPAPRWTRLGNPSFQELARLCSALRDLGRSNQDVETIDGTGFSVRDEANAVTAFAFRNGFIEHLHAGVTGFSDEEMKKLMIESSAKLADVLVARDAAPELYAQFLLAYGAAYSSGWDRRADAYVLVNEHVGSCPACGEPVRIEWAFCASCGGRLAVAA